MANLHTSVIGRRLLKVEYDDEKTKLILMFEDSNMISIPIAEIVLQKGLYEGLAFQIGSIIQDSELKKMEDKK